ncbi:MAG: hypothetical protein K6G57_06410 [Lachnospiraceae bacterium]|nr:hypothetical protein [Lachnospiraceae bacterium]
MSDEYLNNEEETSALFVSAQKKKKAEEEAARKAAEEQAKRDAAEAEVRRMEAEVEERKRKAEEERKALEEQEKQLAEEKLNGPKEAKVEPAKKKEPVTDSIKSAISGKSKLPLFIGIGAVAVLAVVLILVFALRGKGGNVAIDPETTEFNAEYVSKEEGFDLKFSYPDSVYKEVTEEKINDNEVIIHFGGIDVIMTTYQYDDSDVIMAKNNVYFITADSIQKGFQDKVTARVKELIPDIKVIAEEGVDVASENAVRYEYKCTFESAEAGNGAVSSWIMPNSKGEFKRVIVCAKAPKANVEECAKTCALFEDKNCATALAIPGGNPPTATDSDGVLEIESIHMGLIVPKDEFKKYERDDISHYVYYDENGAMIFVEPIDVGGDILSSMGVESIGDLFKQWMNRGINNYLGSVESRIVLDEKLVTEDNALYYTANCKDTVGKITYHERFRAGYWFDERQQKDYFYVLVTMSPEKNDSVYNPIFDKMLDRMKDL